MKKTKKHFKNWRVKIISERYGTLIFLLLLFAIIVLSIKMGMIIQDRYTTLGCWRKVSDTERFILIRTEGRAIEDILGTANHEICHEIDFRIRGTAINNETFADECNPEDYISESFDLK